MSARAKTCAVAITTIKILHAELRLQIIHQYPRSTARDFHL